MDKQNVITALTRGEIDMQGQFLAGSNYTYLVEIRFEDLKLKTVYKPMHGEQPLWDFPPQTLGKREAAAYALSEGLGWDLVPPTVYRRRAPLGAGSVQLFIDHNPEAHYFTFSEEIRQRLRPAALFDVIANNADRKGGHILLDDDNHIWLIDHGICFNVEDKLRTVIWDFSGEEIPPTLLGDLNRLAGAIESGGLLADALGQYLSHGEVNAILSRTRHLVEVGRFPLPFSTRRSYPWPPV